MIYRCNLWTNCFDTKKQSQNVPITFKKLTNVTNVENYLGTYVGYQTVHEGCKNLKCESCGKSFTQADFLSRHIKIIH